MPSPGLGFLFQSVGCDPSCEYLGAPAIPDLAVKGAPSCWLLCPADMSLSLLKHFCHNKMPQPLVSEAWRLTAFRDREPAVEPVRMSVCLAGCEPTSSHVEFQFHQTAGLFSPSSSITSGPPLTGLVQSHIRPVPTCPSQLALHACPSAQLDLTRWYFPKAGGGGASVRR